MQLISHSANQLWLELLYRVFHSGTPVTTRNKETIEVSPITLTLTDPLQNIITVPERRLNYAFMVAEFVWIMAGRDDVVGVAEYNPNIARFSDDGMRFFGAYGPKIVGQLDHIYTALERDLYSRQAVLNIWRENPPQTKDVPCTLNMQFLVRNFRLHAIVNMRSSDAWLGIPYDIFNFSRIQAYVARKLLHGLGSLTVNIGSSHLYREHFQPAEKIIENYDMTDYYLIDGRSPSFTVTPPPHVIANFEAKARVQGEIMAGWYEWSDYAEALAYWHHRNLDLARGHIIEIIREVKQQRKG